MPRAILIGPPGSGKSTVGKSLAKRLKCDFVDTDAVIEADSGKKISEIFIEDGEPFFRKLEESAVSSCIQSAHGIVALGGGAVLSPLTQELLSPLRASVILLNVSISQAAPRVGFNRERPLLAVNPRQQWQLLAEKRAPIYKSLAGFEISTDSMKPQEVAEEIAKYLEAL